jgi:hypothetical protein
MKMSCQDDVEKSVNAGKKTYDANQAGQCMHDLDAVVSDCSLQSDSYPPACDKMLVGALAAGVACSNSGECQPGMSCESKVCTVMPKDGQACLNHQCADNLFCGNDTICHAHRSQGSACPEGNYACADNLFCDPKTTTCQPHLGSGGDCSLASWACSDGLYCSTATKLCTPEPGGDASCADTRSSCTDGLYCDSSRVCQNEKGAGQACTDSKECHSGDCVAGKCSQGSCVFL